MGYFYSFSLTGNITESYFRITSKIMEVISLNFAELSSRYIQRWQPQCCFTKHHLTDLWHCFVHKLLAAWINEAKHPFPKAVCDQFSTCIESSLNSKKDLNLAKNVNKLKTSLSYLDPTSSIKLKDPHPLLLIPPPHFKTGDTLKLGKVLSHSHSSQYIHGSLQTTVRRS